MARDPFAPVVHQSGPPKWVFIVGGCVAFLLIGLASVMFLVISKKSVVAATPPATVAGPSTPTVPAADKPTTPSEPVAANDKPAASDEKGEKSEKGEKAGGSSKKSEPAAAKPAAPAPAPKPKKAMDQREIDKLLGI